MSKVKYIEDVARWGLLRRAALLFQFVVNDSVDDVVQQGPIAEIHDDSLPFAAALAEIEVTAKDDPIGEAVVALHAQKALSAKLGQGDPLLMCILSYMRLKRHMRGCNLFEIGKSRRCESGAFAMLACVAIM